MWNNYIQHEFSITNVHFFQQQKKFNFDGGKESQRSYYLGKFSPPFLLDAGRCLPLCFLIGHLCCVSYNVTHR